MEGRTDKSLPSAQWKGLHRSSSVRTGWGSAEEEGIGPMGENLCPCQGVGRRLCALESRR